MKERSVKLLKFYFETIVSEIELFLHKENVFPQKLKNEVRFLDF